MKKIVLLSFCLLSLFIAFSSSRIVLAARSLSITADKETLFGDEETVITASSSGFVNGETIYIKGAFYQDGINNYFGYTKNSDTWVKNGESTTSQKQIKVGDWDGKLSVKSDFSDSGFKGEGSYKFKVGFYYITSGGNISSVNWSSNALDIGLNEPDPTTTPTNTPAPAPTNTPMPTPTPSKSPTATPVKISPSSSVLSVSSISSQLLSSNSAVLGITREPTNPVSNPQNAKQQNFLVPFAFGGGGIAIAACGILLFLKKKRQNDQNLQC